MKNTNRRNGLNNNNSQLLNERQELIFENLDMENIFSLIRIKNSDSIAVLEKVKAITSIMLNKRRFEYLQAKCFQKSNGGRKVKVGSSVFQDFRVISIATESYNSVRYTILAKYFPRYSYLPNMPGAITGFSLRRGKLRADLWENNAEISILGNFGKEYYVKINFFTYN